MIAFRSEWEGPGGDSHFLQVDLVIFLRQKIYL